MKRYLGPVPEKYARAQVARHQRSWSCIIVPSRTGTSLRLLSRYSPPMRLGSKDVPVLDSFATPVLYIPVAGVVMTPIPG